MARTTQPVLPGASNTVVKVSKFKPARLAASPSLTAFSTPGFSKTTLRETAGGPSQSTRPPRQLEVIDLSISSDSSYDKLSPSIIPLKRSSSDIVPLSDDSSRAKRPRSVGTPSRTPMLSLGSSKENRSPFFPANERVAPVLSPIRTVDKGKGKSIVPASPRSKPKSTIVTTTTTLNGRKQMAWSHAEGVSAWDQMELMEDVSPSGGVAGAMPSDTVIGRSAEVSSTSSNDDLLTKTVAELKTLRSRNRDLSFDVQKWIIQYFDGTNKERDLVVLKSFQRILDQRIEAIDHHIQTYDSRETYNAANTTATIPPLAIEMPHSQADTSNQAIALSFTGSGSDDRSVGASLNTSAAPTTGLSHPTSDDELWASFDHDPTDDTTIDWDASHSSELVVSSRSGEIDGPLLVGSPEERSDPTLTRTLFYPEVVDTLRRVFGLESFRTNQLEAISATLSGKDVFVLMPTGGGKSLCYQLPALCQTGATKGMSVVFSPLIALMRDQVRSLREKGVDVINFSSEQDDQLRGESRARLRQGRPPNLLYLTPEKLDHSDDTRSTLKRLYETKQLARFVVDEAHCLSSWGRDFRKSYPNLDILRKEFPGVPIMALTATASEAVINDVIVRLGMDNCVQLKQSFNRPNLRYEVVPKRKSVVDDIASFIKSRHSGKTGVIYCLGRAKCEEVANALKRLGLKAKHYHAMMEPTDRQRVQDEWQAGTCHIIVATIAFGMGIDKPNVRFVIHFNLPKSLDGYYQETGRAGRDGLVSDCILYYQYADTKPMIKMIQENDVDTAERERQEDALRAVVQFCQNDIDCRRAQVLSHFGQSFDPKDCRKFCNNCRDAVSTTVLDVTVHAVDFLRLAKSLLSRSRNRVTAVQCSSAFRGVKDKVAREKGYENEPFFGKGSGLTKTLVERVIDHLFAFEGLDNHVVATANGWSTTYIKLGSKADDFLSGRSKLTVKIKTGETGAAPAKVVPKRKASKKDTTATAQRRKATKAAPEPEEDYIGLYTDDEDNRDFEDVEDADDGPIASASSAALRQTRQTASVTTSTTARKSVSIGLAQNPEGCYNQLIDLRGKVARENDIDDETDVLDDMTLQTLSLMLPQDMNAFKEVLGDCLDPVEAKIKWNKYGARFLDLCVQMSMARSSSGSSALKVLEADLHKRYEYTEAGSSKAGRNIPSSKAVPKGKVAGSSVVRAMPVPRKR